MPAPRTQDLTSKIILLALCIFRWPNLFVQHTFIGVVFAAVSWGLSLSETAQPLLTVT